MADDVIFEDYQIEVKQAISSRILAALHECAGEMVSRVKRNSRVDTGKTKNSFQYRVYNDHSNGSITATIGSPDENAIWEEFGTGEHAISGNGRKGGWRYKDAKGKWHYTRGKKPSRAFWNAYMALKDAIIRRLQTVLKGM